MQIDISIIIVNYNVRHFIRRTIESIYASKTDGLTYDIHVVDNASIDGSVDMIRSEFPDVQLIANKDNVGFSTANNQAIKIAKGQYKLILNPDTVIEEDTLAICHRHMEAHPQVGALGVKMIDGAGKFLPESKRDLPTIWNSITKLAGLSSVFPKSKLFNSYALGHLDENERHDIQVLCGAFMFVRQEAIDKVGMFDERFFMYGEDIDWSRRIVEGGYQIHYLPDTTIIHYKGESTKKASLNYVKTFYGAMSLYVEKHYTGSTGKWLSRLLKAGISVRATISGLRRLITTLIWPMIDAGLIACGLYAFSQVWARQYFNDPGYYDRSSIEWNIAIYALIWAFVMWFVGYYQKSSWQKRILGILSGTAAILIMYALLPDQFRTSRVMILAGTLIGIVITAITSLLHSRKEGHKKKNILIVADIDTANDIRKSLDQAEVRSSVLGVVNPDTNAQSSLDYLNNITHLPDLSKVLKADEIIFSSEAMTMKAIMKQMMHLDTSLSYKIAGDDSLSILGSDSKNTSGELYNVNIKYNLEDGYYQHIKRVFDFSTGIILLVLSPILLIISGFKIKGLFSNIFGAILGFKTIVGYRGGHDDYQNLPELSNGVLTVATSRDDHTANTYYARDYTVWKDLEILITNLTNLSDSH